MKKMRKNASCLSMENLNLEDDNEDEKNLSESMKSSDLEDESKKVTPHSNNGTPKLDSENVVLHPIFILEKAFVRV
jgi:hypothetical protein